MAEQADGDIDLQEVIVIDGASQDASPAIAQRFGARLISLPSNPGFAYAVNRGIQHCRTPLVAILNNDVRLTPTYCSILAHTLETSSAWFATGRLLSAANPSLIDGTFDLVCRGGPPWRAGAGRPDGPIWRRPAPVLFPPFTAVLLRRELFDRVGMLDERFESYLEDVDFGLRCASAGYTGVYVPRAEAWHAGSATLGPWGARTVRLIARNQVLLVAKHYRRRELIRYGWSIAVAHLLWGALALRHGQFASYLAGKWEGLLKAPHMRRQYRRPGISQLLEQSENLLLDLQRATGWDAYWRAYFLLTRGQG